VAWSGGQGLQVARHQREGIVPGDRLVFVAGGVVDHRVGQAAVLLQLVVRLRQQFGDGVGGEEFGAHALAGGFGRHRLDAVLAEFKGGGMLAVGPGAAGAVEAVRLVLLEQRLVIAAGDLLAHQVDGHLFQRPSRRRDGCMVRCGLRAFCSCAVGNIFCSILHFQLFEVFPWTTT
jgi:hypothetical protein